MSEHREIGKIGLWYKLTINGNNVNNVLVYAFGTRKSIGTVQANFDASKVAEKRNFFMFVGMYYVIHQIYPRINCYEDILYRERRQTYHAMEERFSHKIKSHKLLELLTYGAKKQSMYLYLCYMSPSRKKMFRSAVNG